LGKFSNREKGLAVKNGAFLDDLPKKGDVPF
jgi:hypothetical protein